MHTHTTIIRGVAPSRKADCCQLLITVGCEFVCVCLCVCVCVCVCVCGFVCLRMCRVHVLTNEWVC